MIEDKNFDQAFDCAHTLKGVAGNLALNPLFKKISSIVEKLRAKDYENLVSMVKEIEAEYDNYKKAMEV